MDNIKETVAKGGVTVRSIIEIAGKPKEHVEATLKNYVAKIKEDKDINIFKETYAEAKEIEEKGTEEKEAEPMFSAFVDLDILFKNLQTLTGFCFDYMPSSVEIVEPRERILKNEDFTDVYNDLQAKLHKIDMATKVIKIDKQNMAKNFVKLIENFINLMVDKGARNTKTMADYMGIEEKDIQVHLESLVKKGKIEKDGDFYKVKN